MMDQVMIQLGGKKPYFISRFVKIFWLRLDTSLSPYSNLILFPVSLTPHCINSRICEQIVIYGTTPTYDKSNRVEYARNLE